MTIKTQARRVTGVALCAMTLAGCDFISPVDANPNAVAAASLDQLFTGVQVNTFLLSGGGLSRIGSMWTQQMKGVLRQHGAFDVYNIGESDFEDEWSAIYTQGGLGDIRRAIALAEAAQRIHYAGILKVHEAFVMGLAASFYGDVPYAEAANPDIEAPVVDDQAAVYAALQALLDEAITDLASGSGGVGPADLDMNFGGDVAAWTAVANTLKARYHLHMAEANAGSYALARTAALAGITSVDGDWKALHSDGSATEFSIWSQFQIDRAGDVKAGDYLLPAMVTAADPRIGFYFTTPYTAGVSDLATAGFGDPGYDFPIVSCAENYFILAEAEYQAAAPVAAQAAARNAAACEEAEYGLAADDLGSVTGFVSVGAALLAEIMEQKYVAQFLNPDVFNDYKRTCLPAGIVERTGGMPGRLFYAEQERKTNPFIAAPNVDPNDKYNDNDLAPCP